MTAIGLAERRGLNGQQFCPGAAESRDGHASTIKSTVVPIVPARSLIGTPVFNDMGQRIATISDLLITDDGMVDRVVVSVTQRRKLLAVPFGQLHFVPSQNVATSVGRRADA
jgi:sporulation protein YlmC with PRC-barrel domain